MPSIDAAIICRRPVRCWGRSHSISGARLALRRIDDVLQSSQPVYQRLALTSAPPTCRLRPAPPPRLTSSHPKPPLIPATLKPILRLVGSRSVALRQEQGGMRRQEWCDATDAKLYDGYNNMQGAGRERRGAARRGLERHDRPSPCGRPRRRVIVTAVDSARRRRINGARRRRLILPLSAIDRSGRLPSAAWSRPRVGGARAPMTTWPRHCELASPPALLWNI